ncbi:MAG: DUF2461 domain-containing protein [bacterium]
MKTRTAHFGRGLFEFLGELKANNNREWFNAHKVRYIAEVEEPMLQFIADFGERIGNVSRRFVADPRRIGGSMFRIYRDTRFSRDKTPFKHGAGAHFRHEAHSKDRSVPGFYLHLEPGHSLGGGGIYHPDAVSLKQIRDRIAAKPGEWEAVVRKKLPIEGDTLTRPPAGYDPGHRLIEDIKRKDFYTMRNYTQRDVCSPDFLDSFLDASAHSAPLLKFLTKALGLPW